MVRLAGAPGDNIVDSAALGRIWENAEFLNDSVSHGSIAQRLEQGSHKPLVLGSNPSAPMIQISALRVIVYLSFWGRV
jgi:hypothetical protein